MARQDGPCDRRRCRLHRWDVAGIYGLARRRCKFEALARNPFTLPLVLHQVRQVDAVTPTFVRKYTNPMKQEDGGVVAHHCRTCAAGIAAGIELDCDFTPIEELGVRADLVR